MHAVKPHLWRSYTHAAKQVYECFAYARKDATLTVKLDARGEASVQTLF